MHQEGTKPSGDPPGLQPPHLVGTAWSCPRIRITCAIPNPPNKCDSSWQCPRHQKCCQGACGRRCLSRPPGIPTSHGTVLSEPPAVAVALGREVATAFRAGGGSGALSQPLSLSLPFCSVRARHRPRGFSASPCHLRYQPAACSPGRTVLLGTGTGTAPCPCSETSLAAEPAATGCCLLTLSFPFPAAVTNKGTFSRRAHGVCLPFLPLFRPTLVHTPTAAPSPGFVPGEEEEAHPSTDPACG